MFFGEAKDQADELITRDILFSQPVVTNKFKLIVNEASPSVAIKMDVIGMPPDKKYDADPVLDPISYEDGNYEVLFCMSSTLMQYLLFLLYNTTFHLIILNHRSS